MTRGRSIAITAGILAAGLIAFGAWTQYSKPSDKQQAATWAKRACANYQFDGTTGTANSPSAASTDPADEIRTWKASADDAARAARLDSAWQNLAMAADLQLQAWTAQANNQDTTQLETQTQQYNIDVECRKAML